MIILEFKLKGTPGQYQALDEAIRTTQFIRNKCVRLWQDIWGTTGGGRRRAVVTGEHALSTRVHERKTHRGLEA